MQTKGSWTKEHDEKLTSLNELLRASVSAIDFLKAARDASVAPEIFSVMTARKISAENAVIEKIKVWATQRGGTFSATKPTKGVVYAWNITFPCAYAKAPTSRNGVIVFELERINDFSAWDVPINCRVRRKRTNKNTLWDWGYLESDGEDIRTLDNFVRLFKTAARHYGIAVAAQPAPSKVGAEKSAPVKAQKAAGVKEKGTLLGIDVRKNELAPREVRGATVIMPNGECELIKTVSLKVFGAGTFESPAHRRWVATTGSKKQLPLSNLEKRRGLPVRLRYIQD